jgi:plastocyanin
MHSNRVKAGFVVLAFGIGFAGGDAVGGEFGTSSVVGKIVFEGEVPAARTEAMDTDSVCKLKHPDGAQIMDIEVVEGGVKWAFVYVKEGLPAGEYEIPSDPVVLNQQGCRYDPHVFGVMAGQRLDIKNSDKTLHNVHAFPENSRQFNLAMPFEGMSIKKKFKNPEVMVRINCDVHAWMQSWAGVTAHPFYAVSGDGGAFAIEKLPAGTYVIEAWHSKLGTQTQEVTVADGEATTIEFSFQAAAGDAAAGD